MKRILTRISGFPGKSTYMALTMFLTLFVSFNAFSSCPTPVINGPSGQVCAGEVAVFSTANLGYSCMTYTWYFGANASPSTASGIGPHYITFNSTGTITASLTIDNNCTPNTGVGVAVTCPGLVWVDFPSGGSGSGSGGGSGSGSGGGGGGGYWATQNCFDCRVTTTQTVFVQDCGPCQGQGGDSDNDGICDNVDNCDFTYNPNQLDSDGDGIGDACEGGPTVCNDHATNTYRIVNSDPACPGLSAGSGVFFRRGAGCGGSHQIWTAGSDLYLTEYDNGTAYITGTIYNGAQTGEVEILLSNKQFSGIGYTAACYVNNVSPWHYYHELDGTITVGNTVYTIFDKPNADLILGYGAGNQQSSLLGIGSWTGGSWGGCSEIYGNLQVATTNNGTTPLPPGTACDDGDPTTTGEVILADGCTCGDPTDPCILLGGDTDGDGVCDDEDNCVTTFNSNQADSDGDGVGNVCDNCPDVANADQADSDGDGIGDACEVVIPSLTINDITVNEEDNIAILEVCVDEVTTNQISFNFSTSDNTALQNFDYVSVINGSGIIQAGQNCTNVIISIVDDLIGEPTEDLIVTITNSTNSTILDGEGTITILDDDVTDPVLTINDITVNEEDNIAILEVCIDQVATDAVIFNFSTADNSALQNLDYVPVSNGTGIIQVGQTCTNVIISIVDDFIGEPTENLVVNISNVTNATVGDPQGTITILDTDDPAVPELTINDITVNEEDNIAILQVCVDETSTEAITFNFSTADNSAIQNADYVAVSNGSGVIQAGQTCTNVIISIVDDNIGEPTENLLVNLSNPTNATIGDPQGTITILDTDGPNDPELTINDITVNEEDNIAILQVCASTSSTNAISFNFSTQNNSAVQGADYVAVFNGSGVIQPGQTCTNVIISIVDDNIGEPTENLFVNLSNPTNATIADPQGTVTILDGDQNDPCDAITASASSNNGAITATGYNAPIAFVKVYSSDWSVLLYDSGMLLNSSSHTTTPFPSGSYIVTVQTFTANWQQICNRIIYLDITGPCLDTDGDGVCDVVDNCVFVYNPGQQDSDGDGIGDACDDPCQGLGGDSDGDGVCDNIDNCVDVYNPNQADSDGDGIGDACDNPCQGQGGDSDNDGVCDNIDNCVDVYNPGQADSDGDGIGDACDTTGDPCDDISISVSNGVITLNGYNAPVAFIKVYTDDWSSVLHDSGMLLNSNAHSTPSFNPGSYIVTIQTFTLDWGQLCTKIFYIDINDLDPCDVQGGDSDNDGVCDEHDNCVGTYNPNQADSDGDGIGDACDGPIDPCQGEGGDTDGDGICDNQDNCVDTYNPSQADSDGDGIGDACDTPDPGGNSIGDYVFVDDNDNGIQDAGDYGLEGVYVFLVEANTGENVELVITDEDGFYEFTDVVPGTYRIKFANPGSFHVAWQDQGTNDDVDSDLNFMGFTDDFNFNGGVITNIDAGFVPNDKRSAAILDLAATKQVASVDLLWANNTSFKNENFVIERSADGVNFETLREVADYNSGDDRAWNYEDVDMEPLVGKNYYRVKVMFRDGTHDYTNTKLVEFYDTPDFAMFPNPATSTVYLNLERYVGKDVTISIQDNLGRTQVITNSPTLEDSLLEVDLSTLKNGSYHVYIRTKDGLHKVKKLMVMKTY